MLKIKWDGRWDDNKTRFLSIGILMAFLSKIPVKADVEWIKHKIQAALNK